MSRITVRLADASARVPDVVRVGAPMLPAGPFEVDENNLFYFGLLQDGTLVRVPDPPPAAKPAKKEA